MIYVTPGTMAILTLSMKAIIDKTKRIEEEFSKHELKKDLSILKVH